MPTATATTPSRTRRLGAVSLRWDSGRALSLRLVLACFPTIALLCCGRSQVREEPVEECRPGSHPDRKRRPVSLPAQLACTSPSAAQPSVVPLPETRLSRTSLNCDQSRRTDCRQAAQVRDHRASALALANTSGLMTSTIAPRFFLWSTSRAHFRMISCTHFCRKRLAVGPGAAQGWIAADAESDGDGRGERT